MALACEGAHPFRGLDRDDIVSLGGEPGGIPARARANVQDRRAGCGQQVKQGRVDMFKRQRFVLGDELLGVLIVVRNGLHVTFCMFCQLINCKPKYAVVEQSA